MSIAIPPEASRSVPGMSPQNESTEVNNNRLGRGLGVRWRFLVGPAIRTHAGRARARERWVHAARAGARGREGHLGARVRVRDALGAPAPARGPGRGSTAALVES